MGGVVMEEDRLLTIDEAAARLRASRRTVREWLRVGRLAGVKVGDRWRIPESVVVAFIRKPAGRPRQTDPLTPINDAIAQEGLCTGSSDRDIITREAEGREFYPPLPPE